VGWSRRRLQDDRVDVGEGAVDLRGGDGAGADAGGDLVVDRQTDANVPPDLQAQHLQAVVREGPIYPVGERPRVAVLPGVEQRRGDLA